MCAMSAASAAPSARPAAETAAEAELHRQYLTFALKGESYAVAIDAVKEIIEFGALTAVPMMPSFVRGVMNLRGAVVPVLDLAQRFRQGDTEIARRTCIVIFETRGESLRAGGQTLGVLVDAVHEVLDIAGANIEPPPTLGTRIHPEFIRGMAKLDQRILIVLDLDRVLSIDELARLASSAH